jgi:gamma-glutamyltranspeptidase/glutathione hydrolase
MKRLFLCLFLCAGPVLAQPAPPAAPAPQAGPMVVAGHPLAARAGLEMLREGGTAIDAAIAVQAVLTVVEPQASGIGGGAFLLHWDGRAVTAWDGRETAPAAANEDLFLRDGRPMPFREAVVGGRSVGVPGVMRMLEAAHREHGALPWARLFVPAIRLARCRHGSRG